VFDHQDDVLVAFEAGELERDCVVVLRFQGPAANGMPELHKLTPALSVLQDRGFQVALITDGRMSGASGKVPAAIHMTPEASLGGALARIRNGDVVCLDSLAGTLTIDAADLATRDNAPRPVGKRQAGFGRQLFDNLRAQTSSAESGASLFGTGEI
jgi:phosphogluconate dehydratase